MPKIKYSPSLWYASCAPMSIWPGRVELNPTQPNRIEMEKNQLMELNYFAVLHRFKWIMAFMCRKNANEMVHDNGHPKWNNVTERRRKNLYVSMFQSTTVAVVMENIRKALDTWNWNSNGYGHWNQNESVHSLDFSLLLLCWSIKDVVKVLRSIKWTHLITMPDFRLQNSFA